MFKDDNNEDIEELLKCLSLLPYEFENNTTNIDVLLTTYTNNIIYNKFKNYFNRQWLKYFKNGMLNYFNINRKFRSNLYIENYNRRIKMKLSNYLYGKNKIKLSWPIFLLFIKNEEEKYYK